MSADPVALLLRRARREPAATVRRARGLLHGAALADALRLRHAIVLAHVENGELGAAEAELGEALSAAGQDGRHGVLTERLGELGLSAAWVQLERGNVDAARARLTGIHPQLGPAGQARARCLYGLLHYVAGDCPAALSELDAAVHMLRRTGDRHWLANALVGRAAAAAYQERFAAADADFERAAAHFLEHGDTDRAACCVHNRGFVAARRGDLAAALRFFEQADRAGVDLARHPELLVDRAEAFLAAGLLSDARAALRRAADLLDTSGRETKLADLLLVAADCASRVGDYPAAIDSAARATRLLGIQRRPALLPVAKAIWLRARLAHGAPTSEVDTLSDCPSDVHDVAAECERYGWWLAATELRLAAGQCLDVVARQRSSRTAGARLLGWLVTARLAAANGEHAAVRSAAETGLRLVERQHGTWELRSAALRTASELAELGLAAALHGGRARCAFRWIERHRTVAAATSWPTADGADLDDALARLRDRELGGGSRESVAAAERAVRRVAVRVGDRSVAPLPLRANELGAELAERALLSWAVRDGTLSMVSVVDSRFRLHGGPPVAQVNELVESLRFAGTPTDSALAAVTALLTEDCAERLDELLLAPVRREIGERPLVVVPGPLHGLPWAILPSCQDRAVSVAPSAAAWLRAHRARERPAHGHVWAAGPRLRHAETEARGLHSRFGGRLLRRCGTGDLLSAMDGAEVAHVAAHGEFRADAPLFSGLRLADGLLYALDLHRLRSAPKVLVLASCESARQPEQPLGLGTALLASGCTAVIASLLAVPDDRAAALLGAVHDNLACGLGPATALARAQTVHGHLGFVCLGAG